MQGRPGVGQKCRTDILPRVVVHDLKRLGLRPGPRSVHGPSCLDLEPTKVAFGAGRKTAMKAGAASVGLG